MSIVNPSKKNLLVLSFFATSSDFNHKFLIGLSYRTEMKSFALDTPNY